MDDDQGSIDGGDNEDNEEEDDDNDVEVDNLDVNLEEDFEILMEKISNISDWECANDLLHSIFGHRAEKPKFDNKLNFRDIVDKVKVKRVIDVSISR